MEDAKLDNPWGFFDKIYCISLDERKDRRNNAKIQFSRVGLLGRVEFAIMSKHPENCEQGIYESHMACIRRGIREDARNILIFEDDIYFERFSHGTLRNCVRFLSDAPDWDLFFLGCLVKGSKRTDGANVLEVKFRSLAHAYAVKRRFAEVLIEKPWQGMAFDEMLSTSGRACYAMYPSIAFQSGSPTDNTKYLQLDKFRRLCGGLRFVQKMNEAYHLHKRIFILLHVLPASLVLLWILLAR